jgi:hypothetical protein
MFDSGILYGFDANVETLSTAGFSILADLIRIKIMLMHTGKREQGEK